MSMCHSWFKIKIIFSLLQSFVHKKYWYFTINSLVRFAHSFVYSVKYQYFLFTYSFSRENIIFIFHQSWHIVTLLMLDNSNLIYGYFIGEWPDHHFPADARWCFCRDKWPYFPCRTITVVSPFLLYEINCWKKLGWRAAMVEWAIAHTIPDSLLPSCLVKEGQ